MKKFKWYMGGGSWALLIVIIAVGTSLADGNRDQRRNQRAKTLYVWAGDQARVALTF